MENNILLKLANIVDSMEKIDLVSYSTIEITLRKFDFIKLLQEIKEKNINFTYKNKIYVEINKIKFIINSSNV